MSIKRFIKSLEFLVTTILILIVFSLITSLSLYNKEAQADPLSQVIDISGVQPKVAELNHPYQKLFEDNCTVCHAIDRKLVGPALRGVTERREMEWILKMVKNSSKLIAEGDPIANKLYKEFNGFQMTSFDFLSDEDILGIVDYIMEVSKQ